MVGERIEQWAGLHSGQSGEDCAVEKTAELAGQKELRSGKNYAVGMLERTNTSVDQRILTEVLHYITPARLSKTRYVVCL